MIIYNIICVNYCKFMPWRHLKRVQTVKSNSGLWQKGVLGGTRHNHAGRRKYTLLLILLPI